ncbi:hypothetical protein Syun_009626 [Stephania yunnanensis]|uniref:Uncharacterized protein n=1 Tax=Stephania yunnanensis TaxID=152371 RepID=A0AAP0KEZ9_9MAGN
MKASGLEIWSKTERAYRRLVLEMMRRRKLARMKLLERREVLRRREWIGVMGGVGDEVHCALFDGLLLAMDMVMANQRLQWMGHPKRLVKWEEAGAMPSTGTRCGCRIPQIASYQKSKQLPQVTDGVNVKASVAHDSKIVGKEIELYKSQSDKLVFIGETECAVESAAKKYSKWSTYM